MSAFISIPGRGDPHFRRKVVVLDEHGRRRPCRVQIERRFFIARDGTLIRQQGDDHRFRMLDDRVFQNGDGDHRVFLTGRERDFGAIAAPTGARRHREILRPYRRTLRTVEDIGYSEGVGRVVPTNDEVGAFPALFAVLTDFDPDIRFVVVEDRDRG